MRELSSGSVFQFLGHYATATIAIETRVAKTTTIGIASLD